MPVEPFAPTHRTLPAMPPSDPAVHALTTATLTAVLIEDLMSSQKLDILGDETADTLVKNALKQARALRQTLSKLAVVSLDASALYALQQSRVE